MSESTRGSAPVSDEQWQKLARYIAGESSAAEAADVDAWLTADPLRRELLDALQRFTVMLQPGAPHDVDVESALQRVSRRLNELPLHSVATSRRRRTGWTVGLVRAAALLVVIGGALFLWYTVRPDPSVMPVAVAGRTLSTPVGSIDSVRLADGTRVLLAPGTRVTVPSGFGVSAHEVELAGEALFDVAPAAAGRFTVRAGPARIRDLGTTFSVRSDPAEIRVVVTSGSVALSVAAATDTGAVLHAGDRAVVPRGGTVSIERGGATRDDLAWTAGRLVFDDATLAQVADELRRWYGIRLQFADSTLAARHFTASFQGEDAQKVLDVLALALDVEIERTGENAIMKSK